MLKKRIDTKGIFSLKAFLVILLIILLVILFVYNKDSITNNKTSELTKENSYPESPPIYSESENIGPPPPPPTPPI